MENNKLNDCTAENQLQAESLTNIADDLQEKDDMIALVTQAGFEVLSCETFHMNSKSASKSNLNSNTIVNQKGKMINIDSIPYVLRAIGNWVIQDNKKPKNSRTGGSAKSNDPSTWSTFEDTVSGFLKYNADGIGIMLTLSICIAVFDFDHVRDPETGELHPLVQEFLDMLPKGAVYTEISQSGDGLHLFFRYTEELDLSLFTKCKMEAVFGNNTCCEFYIDCHYIITTGNLLSEKFSNLRSSPEVDNAIINIYKRCFDIYNGVKAKNKPKTDRKPAEALSRPAPKLSDDDVIRLAYKQNSKFQKLAKGDLSDYDNDDSRADAAFFWILAYYTKDPQQLESIYRRSPLSRDKFDRPWGESTYGQHLIDNALNNVTAQYYPKSNAPLHKLKNIKDDFTFSYKYILSYPLHEIGTAQLYVSVTKDIIAFIPEEKHFIAFDGVRWNRNNASVYIEQSIKKFVLHILEVLEQEVSILDSKLKRSELSDAEKESIQKDLEYVSKLKKYYSGFTKRGARNKLIQDIESEINVSLSEFDKDPHLLNCANGTLNLNTYEMKEHDPKDYITMVTASDYNPNAKFPRWDSFVNEIMQDDSDKIDYLQTAIGYSLLGEQVEEKFFVAHGITSRNGKSCLFESISHCLGDYCISVNSETFCMSKSKDGSSPKPDLLRFCAKRMIVTSEVRQDCSLNTVLLKQCTGNDTLTARGLYTNEYIEFRNNATIFILSNFTLNIDDQSIFNSNRINVIEFSKHFPDELQDVTLKTKFRSKEATEYILKWAVEGLKKYQKNGLKMNEKISKAIADYQYSCDSIQQFIDQKIIPVNFKNQTIVGIKLIELRKKYVVFAQEAGIKPLGLRDFREELIKRGIEIKNKNHQYYAMCTYLPDDETRVNNTDIIKGDENWRRHPRDESRSRSEY